MTIYVDVVFLENMIMNSIILYLTSNILMKKRKLIRIHISSGIGSIFLIINYLIKVNVLLYISSKFIISVLMVIVAFRCKNVSEIVKSLFAFYLVSFLIGGICFYLISNFGYFNNPLKVSIVGAFFGILIVAVFTRCLKKEKYLKIYDVEIHYRNRMNRVRCLLDSGNLLRDPVTNNSVIIVEIDELKDLLQVYNSDICNNIRIIPYSSLGNEDFLIGFKPDYIKIVAQNEIVRNDIVVAIYKEKLSKNNQYSGLIGLEAIE